MKELWDYHDHIIQNTPKRSVYWGLQSTYEEADEWRVTDSDINEDQFLEEGADIIIAYMTTMKSAGYSYEVAMQAIYEKMNVVIDRVVEADILSRGGTMSFDTAYKSIKELEKDDVV